MSENRIYNFNAGPAILPLEVIESVRDNLLNFKKSGIGLMEMSHRSPEFEAVIQEAERNLRELLSISDDYAVLFTSGGATQQFSMVPMNLLASGQVADYIITGSWAKNAYKEAKKFGAVHVAASSEEKNFTYIPKAGLDLSSNSAYVHFTSNNTIFGTQFKEEPDVGDRVLVCDASSDFLHRKIDIRKYGVIYAGAQKNLGPAGVTMVVIRKNLLQNAADSLPIMLNYRTYSEHGSLYNTPPVFAIYVVGEVLKWIKNLGGLESMGERNRLKAGILYDAIDNSDFYYSPVVKEDRSLMNVVFRLTKQELEAVFIKEAEKAGFAGLKGHRSVGGIRASIYNAFPLEGVQALTAFMREFENRNSKA